MVVWPSSCRTGSPFEAGFAIPGQLMRPAHGQGASASTPPEVLLPEASSDERPVHGDTVLGGERAHFNAPPKTLRRCRHRAPNLC